MDVLSAIMKTLEVEGSLYFRTAFHAPWGVRVPLHGKVVRFHLMTRGACWVKVDGVERPVHLESGDLIVIPHGTEHLLLDQPTSSPLDVDKVLERSGFTGKGALVWGAPEGSEPTCMVCGHFSFNSERGTLLDQSLPAFIHVPHTETLNYGWLDEAMKFIAHEAAAGQPGGVAIINRLSEIILIQTLRSFAATRQQKPGLLAALADEHLHKSLEAFHADPRAAWTVDELARAAAMSRTAFSERMRQVLGVAPMEYVTNWRMEHAHKELSERRGNVAEVAESVGYQSHSSFTRAFRRRFGRSPGDVLRKR